jgi:hypothetical protein
MFNGRFGKRFNYIGIFYKYIENYIDNNEDVILCGQYESAKVWHKNSFLHRDNDLPAVEFSNGNKEYWKDGKLHRIKGPAIEYKSSNYFVWYYEGEEIDYSSQEEFERILKLKLFW